MVHLVEDLEPSQGLDRDAAQVDVSCCFVGECDGLVYTDRQPLLLLLCQRRKERVVNDHEQPRGVVIERAEGDAFETSLPTLLEQLSSSLWHIKRLQRSGETRGKEIEQELDLCVLDALLVVA